MSVRSVLRAVFGITTTSVTRKSVTRKVSVTKSDKSYAFHFQRYDQSYVAELADRAQKSGLVVLNSLPAMRLLILEYRQDIESLKAMKAFETSIYADMEKQHEV